MNAPEFALPPEEPKPELTPEEFMAAIRAELKRLHGMSDAEIAEYTEDEHAWLNYQSDGYSPNEAVEEDRAYWD